MMKLSLRTKFLLVMASLLVVAVVAYLLLAIDLFNKDKSTFIFEGNAALVGTLAAQTESELKAIDQTLDLLAATANQAFLTDSARRQSLDKIFKLRDSIVEFNLYASPNDSTRVAHLVNHEFLKPYDLDKSYLSKVREILAITPTKLKPGDVIVQNVSIKGGAPLLALGKLYSSQDNGSYDQYLIALLKVEDQVRLYSRSKAFTTYLTDSFGRILIHPESETMFTNSSNANSIMMKEILGSKFERGVRSTKANNGKEIIYGFARVRYGNLIVVSEIERDKAFLASQRLIEKSVYFALLIISLAFIVSLLFSKSITASISKLYMATQEIMKGNFLVNVQVQSRDEVGALSESFNKMTSEISRLMAETADKARMEKELETAQIVQDNFFPVDEVKAGNFDIAAYYKPASECGGDWWGHIDLGDKIVILIGDATGHGVPSALITAAAQSCCTTLEEIHRDNPDFSLRPAAILEKLNTAIFRGGRGHVKMTFFVGVIDTRTGVMEYANGSHDMPMLCRPNQDDIRGPRSKSNIEVCQGKTGMILGHQLDTKFPEHQVTIEPGGVLALFTDGILECKNDQDEMFGKGRFLRCLYKVSNESAKDVRDKLIAQATDHYGNRERDDDVTLVIVKHREDAVPAFIREQAS